MRKVIFRGKRIDNGKWVKSGNTIQFLDDGVRSVYIPQVGEKCRTEEDAVGNLLSFENGTFYKVDNETVGQFTGLVDKNGVKVFEGDILSVYEFHPATAICNERECTWISVVFWNDGGFCLKQYDNTFVPLDLLFSAMNNGISYPSFEGTIIGNIYDNPELLAEEETPC